LFCFTDCGSQSSNPVDRNQQVDRIDRKPAVAGRYYSSDPKELANNLNDLFSQAIKSQNIKNTIAIVAPHAGYPYSGGVAASSFNQIDRDKQYSTIFIIATSHTSSFTGASVYSKGNYITPLGTVEVNIELAEKLIEENKYFNFYRDAHWYEHSIEVQLPFLQHILKNDFKILPVLIGTRSLTECENIAEALIPYFTSDNLFIVSSDFSHYPAYKDALLVDKNTADAIISNSSQTFLSTIRKNESKNISNLATSICGWPGMLTMLYMTENNPNIFIKHIEYKNSGDIDPSLKDKVVGYHSIVFTLDPTKTNNNSKQLIQTDNMQLSDIDKRNLLEIARQTIVSYINNNETPKINVSDMSKIISEECGAFVTLHKDNKLRGCIGRFIATEPLYKVVQDMAIASSTQDYRFPRVTPDEIENLEIEISVLTPLKKIKSIDEIEMGKHGIYIKKGSASGTFLPQVAGESGWTKEEFLGHCARDKARIGWDGWKNADIFTYEAIVFSEKNTE